MMRPPQTLQVRRSSIAPRRRLARNSRAQGILTSSTSLGYETRDDDRVRGFRNASHSRTFTIDRFSLDSPECFICKFGLMRFLTSMPVKDISDYGLEVRFSVELAQRGEGLDVHIPPALKVANFALSSSSSFHTTRPCSIFFDICL